MKCGEIWARSARSSAWARRSSCAASARQLDLRRDEARDLADHARVLGPEPSLGAVERGQPADPLVADDERRDHRVAVRVRPALDRDPLGVRQPLRRRVAGAHAVRGEHVLAVVDQHPDRVRERVQVHDRLARRLLRQPFAQVRERRRRGVQRRPHALLAGRQHPPRPREPPERDRRRGEHHPEQHAEQDVHTGNLKGPGPFKRRACGRVAGDAVDGAARERRRAADVEALERGGVGRELRERAEDDLAQPVGAAADVAAGQVRVARLEVGGQRARGGRGCGRGSRARSARPAPRSARRSPSRPRRVLRPVRVRPGRVLALRARGSGRRRSAGRAAGTAGRRGRRGPACTDRRNSSSVPPTWTVPAPSTSGFSHGIGPSSAQSTFTVAAPRA